MKFSSIGRGTLASILSLATCLGITACSRDYTVAFLYSLGTKDTDGHLNVFQVDYQSGALLQLPDSPVSTQGTNPVGIVVTSDQKNLYVVNNLSDNVTWFKIGTDGKAYAQPVKSTVGSRPVAVTISADQKFLYILNTYRTGQTSGPGQIDIFPIGTDYSLGTSTGSIPVGVTPIGLVASPDNNFVYVIDRDANTSLNLLGFQRTVASGTLTALAGTTVTSTNATGYSSGIEPSSIVEDPKSRYLYVTDRAANQIIGYTLSSGGVPAAMNNSPFTTGSYPVAAVIDPRGKYVYVANYNANSVSAYALDVATGTLSSTASGTGVSTGTGPTCVTIENALGIYLFTSNKLDGSISGLQLNASTGALKNIQNTPFSTSAQPSCAVAVANGEHATQIVQ